MKTEIKATRIIYGEQCNVVFSKTELLSHYALHKHTNGDKHFISFVKIYFNQRFNIYKSKRRKEIFKEKALPVLKDLLVDFNDMDYLDITQVILSIIKEIKK